MFRYEFRLYPSKSNEKRMKLTLNRCRFVYNKMLEGLNLQKTPDKYKLQNSIPKLKEKNLFLKEEYAKTLQYESHKLFANLKLLGILKKKGRKVGRLRFKGEKWFKSFVYNQFGFKIIDEGKRFGKLHLSKIGDIPIRLHRKIDGKIKQVTIKYCSSNKWIAFLSIDKPKEKSYKNKRLVGIDVGINNFVYDTDGNYVNSPKYLSKSLDKLKLKQKILSNKKKGSSNYKKHKLKLAKIYEKITNQRDDFLHKLSRFYVDNYKFIAVENLDIKGLIMKSYNPRNMMDASWNKFLQFIQYKAESAGIGFAKVEPRGTTQKCSNCGNIVPKKLWNRTHKCECGLEIDRDYNSARNILLLGLEQSNTPLETENLVIQNDLSMSKEANKLISSSHSCHTNLY